jgi:hypothetical protein
MKLIRPRLTDFHEIYRSQAELDFAIPFLDEDIPLYVDPFLLWKSPSLMDVSLHTQLISSFNYLNRLSKTRNQPEALHNLILASECDEVGLGVSAKRAGKRIGQKTAKEVLSLFDTIPHYSQYGFTHFEEIQLYVQGISKDRISDMTCNFLKSFLIDFTVQECEKLGIPIEKVALGSLYSHHKNKFELDVSACLPVHPESKVPLIFVPKRWLRYNPWINFENYFSAYCPKDEVHNRQGADDRVSVLTYNRENFGLVREYVSLRERQSEDCQNDPLFKQIPILSAKRKLEEIKKIPTGLIDGADKRYERAVTQLLASLLYPHLDFASEQVRSDSGVTIKDLVFYNNRDIEFLSDISKEYNTKQLVFEMKNVQKVERDHINQINRYLTNDYGSFGVILTRNPLPKPMFKNTIDLWSGQRRCILALTDQDLELMVNVFESKQRQPIEVLKRKYIEFVRACPS